MPDEALDGAYRGVTQLMQDMARMKANEFTSISIPAKQQSLNLAIERAVRFVELDQRTEGCWSDFRTLAGESTGWVTGYIGFALSQIENHTQALSRAYRWAVLNQLSKGGWGYSQGLPVDADSTSWCLLLLACLTSEPDVLSKAIEMLKTHQSPTDGGFRTYFAPDPIRTVMNLDSSIDFSGWCSSQTCVTAVATQALLKSGLKRDSKEIQSALEYIRRQQDDAGYWEAYWWDGRMYSTYHCIQVLKMAGVDEDEERCQKAAQWLLSIQLKDASWNNGVEGEGEPFHTALAVQALLKTGEGPACEAAGQGIIWLLQEQVTNGSWRSCDILRIPSPELHCPWKKRYQPRKITGTGIVVRDQHRLFTTATVLGALGDYFAVIRQSSS